MIKALHTTYGKANLNPYGYYVITSTKEDNEHKRLHRLIAADYFGDWINDPKDFFEIHHIDGDRTNNCVLNLEPIKKEEHCSLHNKGEKHHFYGKHHSKETKMKIKSSLQGRNLSKQTKLKISASKNTTGYFRVSKRIDKSCKQGFIWVYGYYENNNPKSIVSVSINKLESKVRAKGLDWIKFSDMEDKL